MTDVAAAAQFIAGHARLLERRRFARLVGTGSPDEVRTALAAYRNPDGGIGHLEPDLRTPESQPSCVLYALEILGHEATPDAALVGRALDWLGEHATNADGGVPFVLASARGWPHAPWWEPQDDPPSSLLMTAALAARAHHIAPDHPWLPAATAYCWTALAADAAPADAYTLRYVVDFLDAVADRQRADATLDGLAGHIPRDGLLAVGAGAEGEVLRPLDLAPSPDHAGRRLFDDDVIERELDVLDAGQAGDGGWTFTWAAWNPAAAWEWRGVVTIAALRTLAAYHRVELGAT